mgnify:CR=1 FL=1
MKNSTHNKITGKELKEALKLAKKANREIYEVQKKALKESINLN